MKALNPRQIRFVQEYVQNGGNATAAARQAGYRGDDASLAAAASRLLRNVKVRQMVEDAQRDVQALYQAEAYRNFVRELDLAIHAESETVLLAAIKDMQDRAGLKPVEKHEHRGDPDHPLEVKSHDDLGALKALFEQHPELVATLLDDDGSDSSGGGSESSGLSPLR